LIRNTYNTRLHVHQSVFRISPTSQRTINSGYLPSVVINSRADRNLLKWQQGPIPIFLPIPFCHKSKSYDKPRYTFIIANSSHNSSYRRIASCQEL